MREPERVAPVCSYKHIVFHHVAEQPSRKREAWAEGLWIRTQPAFSKSPSCLRQLNGDIYILCPAEVSAACLRMPSWPYSQHKAQIFTDVEERAAAQRGVSEFQLTGDGFMEEKNSTTAMVFFFSPSTRQSGWKGQTCECAMWVLQIVNLSWSDKNACKNIFLHVIITQFCLSYSISCACVLPLHYIHLMSLKLIPIMVKMLYTASFQVLIAIDGTILQYRHIY